jgi:signal transduction histidine kinase
VIDPLVATAAATTAGFVAASAGLMVQVRKKRTLADRGAALERQLAAATARAITVESQVRRFAGETMPALVDVLARGYRGVQVPELRHAELAGTAVDEAHREVRRLLEEALTVSREQVGRVARSAVREVIEQMQTVLHRCQLTVIEEMTRHPDGTAYHQSLMSFDHRVTQALHTLQRVRILTGSWPGLQRADCTVSDVVESARGRIAEYGRVHYRYDPSTGDTWLDGQVAEPVTVALTELLSNATAYSHGTVHVEVQAWQTGHCIVVDDGGLNMHDGQRRQAAQQLAQHEVLDFASVRDTGQLGFAVIGRLAGQYGFAVDVSSTSPYGGVRAVLRIPQHLFGHGPTAEEVAAERQAAMTRTEALLAASTTPGDGGHASPAAPEPGGGGLPQRRRRTPRPAAPARAGAPAPADDPDAFAAGLTHLGRTIHDTEKHTNEGDQPHA